MTQAYSENCMAGSKGNYLLDQGSFVRSISDVFGCVACKALQLEFSGFTLLFIFHQDTRHRSEADRRGPVRR